MNLFVNKLIIFFSLIFELRLPCYELSVDVRCRARPTSSACRRCRCARPRTARTLRGSPWHGGAHPSKTRAFLPSPSVTVNERAAPHTGERRVEPHWARRSNGWRRHRHTREANPPRYDWRRPIVAGPMHAIRNGSAVNDGHPNAGPNAT